MELGRLIAVRLTHPEKASSSIVLTESGINMFCNASQSLKAHMPISLMELGITTLSSFEHPSKGPTISYIYSSPSFIPLQTPDMLTNELGKVILVSAEQSAKVPDTSVFIFSGIFTLFKFVHPAKAKNPISSTELDKDILCRLVQFLKQRSPMVITELGISIFVRLVHPSKRPKNSFKKTVKEFS